VREISPEQVISRIRTENPWWESGAIPEAWTELTPRPYLDLFLPLVEDTEIRRAAVLMGPRRVGKTVLLHHSIARLLEHGIAPRQICYLSVDHPIYTGLGLDNLLDLYFDAASPNSNETQYVFFDEIQYLREWEVHLKALVDDRRDIRLVASGSAAAALRLKTGESGAGRFTDFFLPPLTFYEFLFLLGEEKLVDTTSEDEVNGFYEPTDIDALNSRFIDYINYGGYPEVVLSEAIRADMGRFIKSDIVDKVLLRDLPSLYGIRDIQELNYLFTTLAFNTAHEVSLEGLSQNSGVAKNTIKRYIEYLEAAFLVKAIHRVDRSAKRFKRQNFFKIYLANPSMRSALFAPIDGDHEAIGDLAETAAFSQWFHGIDVPLHFARWKTGEIDLVSVGADQTVVWATEMKWSDRILSHPEECTGYVDFAQRNRLEEVLITTRTISHMRVVEGIKLRFVPMSVYCFTVGYNLVRSKQRLGAGRPGTEN
jgi:uncharacterized protein